MQRYKSQVCNKILGDGNFAVVRKCKDKTTGKEYALKVIDKAKCKGKEHYVEAEVKHLSYVIYPYFSFL